MKKSKLKVYSVKLTEEQARKFLQIGEGNRSAGIVKSLEDYQGVIPRMKKEWLC